MPDLSDYTSLVTLELSRWQMNDALETREKDFNMLLSPELQQFRWCFAIEYEGPKRWGGH